MQPRLWNSTLQQLEQLVQLPDSSHDVNRQSVVTDGPRATRLVVTNGPRAYKPVATDGPQSPVLL